MSHAELYKIIVENNIECAFPNVDIGFHIFLTLMVTNCSAERSFSRFKYIRNPIRTTMQQGRLDALSLLRGCVTVLEIVFVGQCEVFVCFGFVHFFFFFLGCEARRSVNGASIC